MASSKIGSNQFHSNAANPFAKALFEIGGTTVKQTAALPGQMVNDAMSAIFGGGQSTTPDNQDSQNKQSFDSLDSAHSFEQQGQMEKQRQEMNEEKQRALLHKEFQMTEVFNLREEKDKQVIKELQEQLQKLASDMNNLEASATTSIHSDVVNPGTYHVSFFQQLLNFVVLMRKRVNEANTWIQMFQSKNAKKQGFWGKVYSKQGGTAYMMSQEHQIARSVG